MILTNEIFTKDFKEYINLPVEQDIYTGKSDKFFEFTYEDERPIYWADDKPLFDNTYVALKLSMPREENYFVYKKKTVEFFETRGFRVTGTRTYVEPSSNNKTRCTVFHIEKLTDH